MKRLQMLLASFGVMALMLAGCNSEGGTEPATDDVGGAMEDTAPAETPEVAGEEDAE
ncbi:hypothetical protein IPG41_03890 [Candidatus Peregrinibacteria bacterium]|nr:MAG: hypothetical protein IPG41_03890 [Candidatus Peregrinibacteria bacterium]